MSSAVVGRHRRAALAALAAYALFLGFVLLSPSAAVPAFVVGHATAALRDLGPAASFVVRSRVEFGLNAVMVAPLLFLAALLWPGWTWHRWTAYGFLGSCSVELFQGVFLPARSAQFADVVANTLGVLVGAAAAHLVLGEHRSGSLRRSQR